MRSPMHSPSTPTKPLYRGLCLQEAAHSTQEPQMVTAETSGDAWSRPGITTTHHIAKFCPCCTFLGHLQLL